MPSPTQSAGLIVYRGRGGSSGTSRPRLLDPLHGSGSAALPLPWQWDNDEISCLPSLPKRLIGRHAGAWGRRAGLTSTAVRSYRLFPTSS